MTVGSHHLELPFNMIYRNRKNSTKIITAGQACITSKHMLRGLIEFVVVDGM
jgi:hypothetical protein